MTVAPDVPIVPGAVDLRPEGVILPWFPSPHFSPGNSNPQRKQGPVNELSHSAISPRVDTRSSRGARISRKHSITSFRTLCRTGTPARQSTIDGQECPSYVHRFCSKTSERVLSAALTYVSGYRGW